MDTTSLPKSTRAKLLGVSRSSLYYARTRPERDWIVKQRIEAVLRDHPGYGYRRVALHLRENKKKIQRVMRAYGIKAYRRRGKTWKKPRKRTAVYPNLLLTVIPQYPGHVWVADFTHVTWRNTTLYIATVMDVYTRTIVGVSILTTHATVLVVHALYAALLDHPRPTIFHSDNGSEYDSDAFIGILTSVGMSISRSKPGCPWENGYQESFYGKFKVDLGDPNRFSTMGRLVAEIYRTIWYYNHHRIHSSLRMSPRQFAERITEGMISTTYPRESV
jgi:transposase InsO family protein